jgi:arylsulfatase A-like enzyme
MMDKLRSLGELDDTLIVVTADHASTHSESFYGVNKVNGGDTNWYYGSAFNDGGGGIYNHPSPSLQPLVDLANVAFSYQSTGIETWLIDQSWSKKIEAAKAMRTLPGVVATYIRNGNHYVLDTATQTSTKMTFQEKLWWWQHGQELVDTMAFDGAADVLGLLADKTGYGVYGDHGSFNRDVQHIPMVIYTPGIKHEVSGTPMRLVDIMPTVLKTMGIPLTHSVDGHAIRVEMKQKAYRH